MLHISGYRSTEKLYESHNSLVYRAVREGTTDEHSVILKVLKPAYPSSEKVAWFKREYELTRDLALEGVVKVYELRKEAQQWVMVLEDFAGESLKRLSLAGQMGLADFLEMAIDISSILGQIHARHVMHKDINPANVVFNPTTRQVKIIDFGISAQLPTSAFNKLPPQHFTFAHANLVPTAMELAGTLAYISPEQTGRMNRTVDYRTDFYSLGATFYELLTGQLPFSNHDPLELVHFHIAKTPRLPHEVNPAIPLAVSSIIMKLLAKTAQERYQSAWGIKADLQHCLNQLHYNGKIEPFPLGRRDISEKLNIPSKLYGRKEEIETLLAEYESMRQGQCLMILVRGYAGIGKSALVQEMYTRCQAMMSDEYVTRVCEGGYFISGKFDLFQRNVPYQALISAFSDLVQQVLSKNEEEIGQCREQLLATFGPNGQVMIDLIPDLELLVGPQPNVPVLGPTEAQNRLNLVFQNMLHVLCQPQHPLVIFLDDLQWADSASLNLIQVMMNAQVPYLLLIGAYRDNEISPSHPLIATLDQLRQAGSTINQITLSPFDSDHVMQLITETVHREPQAVQSLAELVVRKTSGNPFFVKEFLKTLYHQRLLKVVIDQPAEETDRRANVATPRWQWQISEIERVEITDNVIELMIGKVKKLSPATQQVLQLAACLGSRFDLTTLALIQQQSARNTFEQLFPAISEGLIVATSELEVSTQEEDSALFILHYRFLHDRVQQAAYTLISEADKKALHLQIGRLMLSHNLPFSEDKMARPSKFFDVANQLNLGRELMKKQDERDELVRLNLMVGRKAKTAAAYQPAFDYLQIAIALLGEEGWQREEMRDVTLALYVEAAEVAYLNGFFAEMEQFADVVLAHSDTVLEQVPVIDVKIQAYIAHNELPEALETGINLLKLFGVHFPQAPSEADMMLELDSTKKEYAESDRPVKQSVEQLIDLPAMRDLNHLAVMRILNRIFPPAYLAMPKLMPLIVLKMVKLSVTHGNARESAFAYANYGLLLCGRVGEIETGCHFGELALALLERSSMQTGQVRTLVNTHFFIKPWQIHLRDTLVPLQEAYQIGLESGELTFAAYALHDYCLHSYFSSQKLAILAEEMPVYGETLSKLRQERMGQLNKLYRQVIANLMGESDEPCNLNGPLYNEEQMRLLHEQANDKTALCGLYFNKLTLSYLFGDYQQALCHAKLAESYLDSLTGTVMVPIFYLYDSLTRLALYREESDTKRLEIVSKVKRNQEKMKKWADHAPMNHLHKYYLVEAELARVLGQDGQAREYYDQAVELATQHEYTSEEALSHELAGKFYLAKDRIKFAQVCLLEAHSAYQRWGALAKVADLESNILPRLGFTTRATQTSSPQLISVGFQRTTPTTSRIVTKAEVLDVNSIVKASQALSGEIVLAKLLQKMLRIVIENAGAQRGLLLLQQKKQWVIEAEGTIDQDQITVLQSIPIGTAIRDADGRYSTYLPTNIIHYVARTGENVLLNDATREGPFTQAPYIRARQPKSVLCMALKHQGQLDGMLYLENNLTTGAFTSQHLQILSLLSSQAAISIEHARLYHTLEQQVEERTQELASRNNTLTQTLQQLKATQNQLIMQEKMASLGMLTAGIAHEIKNPLNLINLFAALSIELAKELTEMLAEQMTCFDLDTREELTEMLQDLKSNATSIVEEGKRADSIVNSMLYHSRDTSGQRKKSDVNLLIAEAVKLAYHSMRSRKIGFNVDIESKYDPTIPPLLIVPQELNRVLLNFFNNAYYAMRDKKKATTEAYAPRLVIESKNLPQEVQIRIRDNGPGIPQPIRDKLFQPFFTTKPAGEGTGLGLSISYDIIVQGHQGRIEIESEVGEYSEFIISLPK